MFRTFLLVVVLLFASTGENCLAQEKNLIQGHRIEWRAIEMPDSLSEKEAIREFTAHPELYWPFGKAFQLRFHAAGLRDSTVIVFPPVVQETIAVFDTTTVIKDSVVLVYDTVLVEVPDTATSPPRFSYLVIEAEEADTISGQFSIESEQRASKGEFIWPATTVDDQTRAVYRFHTTTFDTFYTWGRVLAADGNQNSFYIDIDRKNEEIWGGEAIWGIQNTDRSYPTDWKWFPAVDRDRYVRDTGMAYDYDSYKSVDSFHVALPLLPGWHDLVLRGRERGTRIDVLFITNDPDTIPNFWFDTVPPDTTVIDTIPGEGTTIFWTAPHENKGGSTSCIPHSDCRVSGYEVVYRASPIIDADTLSWYNLAVHVNDEPLPLSPGSLQTYQLKDLQSGIDYWVTLRSHDEEMNWSPFSNILKIRIPE